MTTLEEVDADLPNGLHDAEILRMDIDLEQGEVVLCMNLLVSTSDSTTKDEYRRGEVRLRGVALFSIDPPEQKALLGRPAPLWIVAGPGQPSTAPIVLPPLPHDCFLHWFFVKDWNAFIRVAARDAAFRWTDS